MVKSINTGMTFDDEGHIIQCPNCQHGRLRKKGFQSSKARLQRWICLKCNHKTSSPLLTSADVIKGSTLLAKKNQSLQDTNRIERKAFREHARLENSLTLYNDALLEKLGELNLAKYCIAHKDSKGEPIGLLHLSDLHLNELVEPFGITNNHYDWTVASQRLQMLATRAKIYFEAMGVKKVAIIMTGDLINSDRRMDEMLHMATNRASASVLAVELLGQFIIDINRKFAVQVCNISGNESRMTEYPEYSDLLARDNYDWTIYNFLRAQFKGSGVHFTANQDARENVINLNDQNVLYMHGEKFPNMTGLERKVQAKVGQYASKGILIHFVIFGHYHSARLADIYGRSSSLVGANAYSEDALQLVSEASQNLHIFYDEINRDSIRVGLQDASFFPGYYIQKDLEAYNVKSASKIRPHKTIIEIKI